jgi:undecaprenyl-diphosphatase
VVVIAIGLSRIYLGVHYPSDVIAGYLAAAMWVTTLLVLDRWRVRRRHERVGSSATIVGDDSVLR